MAARPALLRTVGDRWRPVAAVWLWTVCGLPERRDSEERAAMRAMRKESPGVRRYGFHRCVEHYGTQSPARSRLAGSSHERTGGQRQL